MGEPSVEPQEDARLKGNAYLADADYVNAMTCYSVGISAAPRDASLYSNRSLAFVRLGLPARALADAEQAVCLRPNWPKAHFRKAEAYACARLWTHALRAYSDAIQLDPTDQQLQQRRAAAVDADAAQRRASALLVMCCALGGLLLCAAAAAAPHQPTQGPRAHKPAGGIACAAAIIAGAAIGAIGGLAANALQRHNRRGKVLPPLMNNDQFAAMQMAPGGGAGHKAQGTQSQAGLAGGEAAAEPKLRGRSVKHGRAAALRAMRRER